MNKKFYFALAATAALFASCSSDDLTSDSARQMEINDSEAVKVEFKVSGVSAEVTTRGTGSVGVSADGTAMNIGWQGQAFNIYMLDKGQMTLAKEGGNALYNNTEIKTAESTPGSGTYDLAYQYDASDNILYTYYPTGSDDVYDFWAYRLDGAENGAPVGVDDANATEITIPFEIDGSQDIMYATTNPYNPNGVAENKIYSAYSARRSVQPTFAFTHALTRLTFTAIANAKEMAAENVQITGIEVMSKKTGQIVVAYNADPQNAPERVTWTDNAEDWADVNTLTPMALQQRSEGTNIVEDGIWRTFKLANLGQAVNPTGITPSFTLTDAIELYTAQSTHPTTGKPNSPKKTFAQVTDPDEELYFWDVSTEWDGDGQRDLTADLDPLEPVALTYGAGTPATYQATDASATVADEAAYDALDPSLKAGKGDATALDAATIASNVGKYFFATGDKAYRIEEATAAVLGEPTETPCIGDALLLAPADANGYQVTVYYDITKPTNSGVAPQPQHKVSTVTIKRTAQDPQTTVVGPVAFETGKSYNIKIRLYSDGSIVPSTSETPWGTGTGLSGDNNDGSYDF